MRIELDKIDRQHFRVEPRQTPGVGPTVLILPQPTKHRWRADECHLRSLLCSPDGEVLSSGLPKFLNYGEDEWHDRITEDCFARGTHQIADKLDGSLLIRSVIDGAVHWRTRGADSLGSFGGADFARMLEDAARAADNDALRDPTLYPDCSVLFELTHPDNHIVLRYDNPELHALGLVRLGDLRPMLGLGSCDAIADDFGCNAPSYFGTQSDADALSAVAQARIGAEGFVCQMWTATGEPHFAKFKSAEYIRLHSLKQHASPEKIARLAYERGATTLDEFRDAMHADGFDWEAVRFLEAAAVEHFRQRAEVDELLLHVDMAIDERGIADPDVPARDKALWLKARLEQDGLPHLFSYGIQKAKGNEAAARQQADALRCGVTVSQLRAWTAD